MKFGVHIGPGHPGDMAGAEAFEFSSRSLSCPIKVVSTGSSPLPTTCSGSHMPLNPFLTLARMLAQFPAAIRHRVLPTPARAPGSGGGGDGPPPPYVRREIPVRCRTGLSQAGVESLGISPERGARLAEAAQAVRVLCTGQTSSFEGRFYWFEDVSIRPTPIQQPGPPVWVGADTVPTVARVPDIGDAWVASGRHTRRLSGRHSRLFARGWRSLGDISGAALPRDMSPRRAQRRGGDEGRVARAVPVLRALGSQANGTASNSTSSRRSASSSEPRRRWPSASRYRDESDVPFMWFRLYYPGMDPKRALETIRLFGEEAFHAAANAQRTPEAPAPNRERLAVGPKQVGSGDGGWWPRAECRRRWL